MKYWIVQLYESWELRIEQFDFTPNGLGMMCLVDYDQNNPPAWKFVSRKWANTGDWHDGGHVNGALRPYPQFTVWSSEEKANKFGEEFVLQKVQELENAASAMKSNLILFNKKYQKLQKEDKI